MMARRKRVERRNRGSKGRAGAEVDRKVLALSVDLAFRQPRVAFYSPFCSALLNYLKSTKPRFSISEEVASMMEGELMRRYPVLGSLIRKALQRRGVKVR